MTEPAGRRSLGDLDTAAFTGGRPELSRGGMFVDDGLPPEEQREVDRIRMWLFFVPFAFPMWMSLRRTRPDLARKVEPLAWINIAESVALPLVIATAWWAFAILPSIADAIARSYFNH